MSAYIPIRRSIEANRNLAVYHRCKGNKQNKLKIIMPFLILKETSPVPPKGQNRGTITKIEQKAGKDDLGKPFNTLLLSVTLGAKDSAGNPYLVEKSYNLKGRGLRDFCADYYSWSGGHQLTDAELGAFDAEFVMKGKAIIVELSHKKAGKNKLVAVIEKLLPAPVPATTEPQVTDTTSATATASTTAVTNAATATAAQVDQTIGIAAVDCFWQQSQPPIAQI
eukprot:TRINITY_DN1172_c0_g1_i4.p4 TRINITY_DN1172_c0_g1~~TRINITY_DN1172_c0_g1_i4.p4  ORF type:complete len:223 (-),score=0.12 TRINITY_DN1172_c0_g1_i4:1985-2653(-)